VEYVRGILLALNYLHQKHHIIYGALSPDRVLIVGNRSKLLDLSYADFGTGEQTPSFMPPSAYPGNPVDEERDCWAAGIIAYTLVSNSCIDFNELVKLYGQEISVEHLNVSQAYR
jgi:serine/threonine protein kinase